MRRTASTSVLDQYAKYLDLARSIKKCRSKRHTLQMYSFSISAPDVDSDTELLPYSTTSARFALHKFIKKHRRHAVAVRSIATYRNSRARNNDGVIIYIPDAYLRAQIHSIGLPVIDSRQSD